MKDNMKLEMEAGRNIQLDHLNEFITNPQDCESIYVEALKRGNKDLMAENERLKEQLKDYENALKKYADGDFYEAFVNFKHNKFDSLDIIDKKGNVIYTKAQETLKKWGK